MDVVDTLRHADRLVERELEGDARRAALKQRLREIYAGQGIAVPDGDPRPGRGGAGAAPLHLHADPALLRAAASPRSG